MSDPTLPPAPEPAPLRSHRVTIEFDVLARSQAEADHLVFGPGSWYSSVIPHVLVPELLDAILASPAQRILTLNLVPTADETPAYTASRHVEVLAEHAPGLRLDAVVADPSFADGDTHLATYVRSLGARLVVAPVRMRDGSPRHDPHLLSAVYAGIMGL